MGVFSDVGLQARVREEKWRTITDSIIMLWVDIATVEQVRTETVVDLLPWLLSPCPGLTFLSSAVSAGQLTVVDLLPQPFYTQEMTHALIWESRENISPDSFRHVWICHPRSDKVHGQQYKSVSPSFLYLQYKKLFVMFGFSTRKFPASPSSGSQWRDWRNVFLSGNISCV